MSDNQSLKAIDLDFPRRHPNTSIHWENLHHLPSDKILKNLHDLKQYFQADIDNISNNSKDAGKDGNKYLNVLAIWSSIAGYCEAIATHKDPNRRHMIFPIPIDALCRLVTTEFMFFLEKQSKVQSLVSKECNHRDMAISVSNGIWSKVVSKPSARDELHSNSVYVALRGKIDKKTLDCFGATVVTVSGLQMLGFDSFLTLSEDHAYESHYLQADGDEKGDKDEKDLTLTTCELAVPGNTKAAQSKRGRDISFSFKDKSELTPQTSWLYMGAYPVICSHVTMAIAAVLSNVTCLIETRKKTNVSIVSGPLFELKRELLWILYERGLLSKFPYAMMELGDCEEHMPSKRGEKWVAVSNLRGNVLMIEYLYQQAISTSRSLYADGQVYPYCYAGHYHKDAGKESTDQEYRLVEAARLYAQASRVASTYMYERGDSMQLVKVITGVAKVILLDVLAHNRNKKEPRKWHKKENAVATGTWLIGFFDSLLLWEERQNNGSGRTFVEILSPSHECSVGKMIQLFSPDIRKDIICLLFQENSERNTIRSDLEAVTDTNLLYFNKPISARMRKESLLIKAIQKPKVSIRDMELTIPISNTQSLLDGDGNGRSKRARRSK